MRRRKLSRRSKKSLKKRQFWLDKTVHTRVGIGAVLVQEVEGKSRDICYASKSLSDKESRCSQTEKEALALVWGW